MKGKTVCSCKVGGNANFWDVFFDRMFSGLIRPLFYAFFSVILGLGFFSLFVLAGKRMDVGCLIGSLFFTGWFVSLIEVNRK